MRSWNKLKAQPQSWLNFGAGISGVSFGWSFHQGPEFATELYIDTGEKERNESIYAELRDDKEMIEDELGELVWEKLPEKRVCRIKVAKSIENPVEDLTASQKESIIEWGVESMDQMRSVLEHRIAAI